MCLLECSPKTKIYNFTEKFLSRRRRCEKPPACVQCQFLSELGNLELTRIWVMFIVSDGRKAGLEEALVGLV